MDKKYIAEPIKLNKELEDKIATAVSEGRCESPADYIRKAIDGMMKLEDDKLRRLKSKKRYNAS